MAILRVDVNGGKHTISRHIYGHFAEHLGRCIYDGLWVGEDSDIPNVRGIRTDIVEALRAIDIPVLRWPGGCFADEYHWKDGIGPREQRPTMVNTHWGKVTENNHFGTHEFMDLCEQLECEPYICGNVGSGTVHEMQQWVEYVTFPGRSPMADLRAANGHPDPWPLTYWGVGNENWGCGGRMRPEYYADQYRQYATYVRSFGGEPVYRIACGPNSGNYHWTDVLMREAGNMMSGLSLHYYTRVGAAPDRGPATGFGEAEWFATMNRAFVIEELLNRHSTIMDRYDPNRHVSLIVDEWGTWFEVEPGTNPGFLYQQNSLRDALVAAIHLNAFNNHCDRVYMANIAQTVNVLQAMVLTQGGEMVLTPTYHVFRMLRKHQDATLLPSYLTCGDYGMDGVQVPDTAPVVPRICGRPRHVTVPAEPVPQLSASASLGSDGVVRLSIANVDPDQAVDLDCQLYGRTPRQITGEALTADVMDAHNTFGAPDRLAPTPFTGATLDEGHLRLVVTPKSIVVLEITCD
jgi:alpha-N-arabinofuranosidase